MQVGRAGGHAETLRFKNRDESRGKILVRGCPEIFLVEPASLFRIEFRAGLADLVDGEGLDELLHREYFLLRSGIPPEHGKEIDESTREIAVFTIAVVGLPFGIDPVQREHRESHLVTVPLAQFAVADRLEKKREVRESRPRILPAEGLVKKIMEREGRKPFFAADNLGDLHQMVIHDVCEMIGRKFVGLLPENLVIKCVGVDLDVSADEVIHPDDCVLRHLETDCPAAGLAEQPLSLFLRKGK